MESSYVGFRKEVERYYPKRKTERGGRRKRLRVWSRLRGSVLDMI
jgi:hypothetical protein